MDPDEEDLKIHLIAACTVMGTSFPEYEEWYGQAVKDGWGWGGYERDRIREHFVDSDEEADLDDDEGSDSDDEADPDETDGSDEADEATLPDESAGQDQAGPDQDQATADAGGVNTSSQSDTVLGTEEPVAAPLPFCLCGCGVAEAALLSLAALCALPRTRSRTANAD